MYRKCFVTRYVGVLNINSRFATMGNIGRINFFAKRKVYPDFESVHKNKTIYNIANIRFVQLQELLEPLFLEREVKSDDLFSKYSRYSRYVFEQNQMCLKVIEKVFL